MCNEYLMKCDALSDLISFVKLKKLEKHPWSSVTFSKVNTKLYPEISRISLLGTILESRHVCKK